MTLYRFRQTDVSGLGPFNADQVLLFPAGFTLVAGGNGAGKTSIVNELKRQFGEASLLSAGPHGDRDYSWLVFLDDRLDLPYGGAQWAPLSTLFLACNELHSRRTEFEASVSASAMELLHSNLEGGSKFSGLMEPSDSLDVSVDVAGIINVHVRGSADNVNFCFQAVGERIVLYLAINLAIRKLLLLDLPFVVDAMMGALDRSLSESILPAIGRISGQSIVFDSNECLARLGVEPTIQIRVDPVAGRSTLELLRRE